MSVASEGSTRHRSTDGTHDVQVSCDGVHDSEGLLTFVILAQSSRALQCMRTKSCDISSTTNWYVETIFLRSVQCLACYLITTFSTHLVGSVGVVWR